MAYITGSVTDSFGVLPFSLSAGTQLTMSIQNSLSGHSYFGLETVPNGNGFYDSTAPKNISGSFVLGSGIVDVVYDDYKMVAVVKPGGGTLTYTLAVAIDADTLRTRGTGASLGQADFATLAASSYSKRVTGAGGYVESPNNITAAITATPILKDASFLYIPSGYASGTAFSELSTTDYGDLTWSRTSDGTRTNSEGLVQRVPWNLVGYSEAFNNAYWTKSNASISADTTTAPNGTITADTLIEDTSNSTHRIFNNSAISVSTTTASTYSVYLKPAGRTRAWVRDNDIVGALFNLSNGTIVSTEGTATATITDAGNGWYRCTITRVSSTTSGRIVIYLDNGTSETYTGDGTSGIFIWGAQVVEGTSPQSYLPTTTRLNVPRLDYTYGTSPASLMEPQRTNLCLYSQQLDDATWGRTNASVTVNQATAPDGTNTMDLLVFSATSGRLTQGISTTSGSTYTFSVWLATQSGTQTVEIGNINLGVWQAVTVTTTPTRFSVTQVASAATRFPGFQSTAAYSILAWGAQLESGSYPSTYIPTTSTTVTRIVDTFSRSNIYTNGMITSAGGTWYTEFRNNIAYVGDAAGDYIVLGDINSTIGNNFRLYNPPTLSRMQIYKTIADGTTFLYTTTTDTVKVAIKWNGSTADVFVNGTKQISATTFATTAMEVFGTNVKVPRYIQAMALFNQPIAGVDMGVLTGASYYTSYAGMAQANNYTIA